MFQSDKESEEMIMAQIIIFVSLVLMLTGLVFTYIVILISEAKKRTPEVTYGVNHDGEGWIELKPVDDVVETNVKATLVVDKCGVCAWRHPNNCRDCPIMITRQQNREELR